MASINKVFVLGNLGRDPEVRYMPNGDAVTNFSVATSRYFKNKEGERQEETEWHRITCFGRTAEVAGEYLQKGMPVHVEGHLKTRKWKDKDGVDRYTTEIICDQLTLIAKKDGDDSQARRDDSDDRPARPAAKPSKAQTNFDDMDNDIPFLYNTSSVFIAMMVAPSTAFERARHGKEGVREMRRTKADLGVLPSSGDSR